MAFSNQSKNSTSLSNQTKIFGGKTWNEATETWNEATEETWNVQIENQAKNTTSITNVAKN